ncbi:MAG: cohesin domain-containing protein [Pseudomonadota bacterium]
MKTLCKLFSPLLSVLLLVSLQGQATPLLTLAADTSEQSIGGQFNISADISEISDLYAFNFTLEYDASKVILISVTEGNFLSKVNTTYFIPGTNDGMGSVAFSAVALIGPIGGASGAGNLLNFVFAGSAPGVAQFSSSDLLFINSALSGISVDRAPLEVLVLDDPTSVPEPAPLALIVTGALGLLCSKKYGARVRARKRTRA